jgi:hypothetical protein
MPHYFNTSKPDQITFRHSVRASNRTQHFTVEKINWLMLFRQINDVYTENRTRPITINLLLLTVIAGGTNGFKMLIYFPKVLSRVMKIIINLSKDNFSIIHSYGFSLLST